MTLPSHGSYIVHKQVIVDTEIPLFQDTLPSKWFLSCYFKVKTLHNVTLRSCKRHQRTSLTWSSLKTCITGWSEPLWPTFCSLCNIKSIKPFLTCAIHRDYAVTFKHLNSMTCFLQYLFKKVLILLKVK